MKKIIFIFLALIAYSILKAQTPLPDSSIAKNTIFIEGLGNGIIGSLNYDRLLLIKKQKFSYRVGFVYVPIKLNESNFSPFSIPIEFNYLKGRKNHLEIGLGFSYAYAFNSSHREIPHGSNFISVQEFSKAIYLFVKPIGYRFQKDTGGLFVKISGLLLYKALEINNNYTNRANEFTLGPYIGVSIGYTIKNKKP